MYIVYPHNWNKEEPHASVNYRQKPGTYRWHSASANVDPFARAARFRFRVDAASLVLYISAMAEHVYDHNDRSDLAAICSCYPTDVPGLARLKRLRRLDRFLHVN